MAKSNAERQAEYRERKRRELQEEGLPERDIEQEPMTPPIADVLPEVGERDVDQLLLLPVGAELTQEEEQLLREHFGYTASEKRSRVERASAADGVRRAMPDFSTHPSVTQAVHDLEANDKRLAVRAQDYRDSLKA